LLALKERRKQRDGKEWEENGKWNEGQTAGQVSRRSVTTSSRGKPERKEGESKRLRL